MKKILFIILLLFAVNVYADDINLNDIKDNFENITYVEITNLDNIENIEKLVNVREIYIKNVDIKDISFINSLNKLEKISVYYSKIDLSKINCPTLKEMDIIRSYVVNDDFSKLANSNLKVLDLEGSYITSIYTLKNVISIEELTLSSVSNLRSLEPIIYLDNLKILNISGVEELVNDKVFNYIKKNNIIGSNYDEKDYKNLNGKVYSDKLDEIIKNLNLENLSARDKIKKITLYVVDNIEYDDECGVNNKCEKTDISFSSVAKSLSGRGVCYHYALLTNKLLNKVGIKSYLVSGFTRKGEAHEWINLYVDGKWYGLDPTWIEFDGRKEKLRKSGNCEYFMTELTKNSSFYKEHVEDVLPSRIVDPKAVIVDKFDIAKELDVYEIVYISVILFFSLYIIILINKKMK